jgi:hypothetical protein
MGFSGIKVRIFETGWQSKGDPNEINWCNFRKCRRLLWNLVRRQFKNEGTPLRPDMTLEVYLFALFNEDLKPRPTSERNYGLYQPDGTMHV